MLRQVAWVAFTLIGVVAIGNVAAQFRYGESWVSVFLWPELSRHRVTNSGAMRVPGRIAVIYSNDQPACFSILRRGLPRNGTRIHWTWSGNNSKLLWVQSMRHLKCGI